MSICSFAQEKDRLTVCTKGKGKQIPFYNCLLKLGGTNSPVENKILGPYRNVVVDVIGPERDFTFETNRKE